MRRVHHLLLDPFNVPGALVPGLRSHFAGVTREPIPEWLTALARKCDEREAGGGGDRSAAWYPDATQQWRSTFTPRRAAAGAVRDHDYGDKRIATSDRAGRRR